VTGVLRVPRRAALAAIAVLVAAASLTSFAESYRGLWLWAQHHGLHGVWAVAWPLQIDTFIGVGELALFVAAALGRAPPRRARRGRSRPRRPGCPARRPGRGGQVRMDDGADKVAHRLLRLTWRRLTWAGPLPVRNGAQ
jgi:hypothetical protein